MTAYPNDLPATGASLIGAVKLGVIIATLGIAGVVCALRRASDVLADDSDPYGGD